MDADNSNWVSKIERKVRELEEENKRLRGESGGGKINISLSRGEAILLAGGISGMAAILGKYPEMEKGYSSFFEKIHEQLMTEWFESLPEYDPMKGDTDESQEGD